MTDPNGEYRSMSAGELLESLAEQVYRTSFCELHGEELSQMADLIVQEASKPYIYDPAGETVLSAYLKGHRDEFAASLEAYLAPDRASP